MMHLNDQEVEQILKEARETIILAKAGGIPRDWIVARLTWMAAHQGHTFADVERLLGLLSITYDLEEL